MDTVDVVSQFNWESVFRIVLAVFLGGLIGLEREFSGRAAGLRTHILVCVGATLVVLSATAAPRIFGFSFPETIRIDPARISAGVVTGIGFLGAGAILRTGDYVRGLTTAACIWFAATLGIVIGQGFYGLALCSTGIVLVVLRLDELFGARIKSPVYRTLVARIGSSRLEEFEKDCRDLLKKKRIRIQDEDYTFDKEKDLVELKFYIRARYAKQSREIISALKKNHALIFLSWQN